MIEIKRLAVTDIDAAERWDSFVLSCAQATFFHRAGWQRVLRQVFRHETYFLYAENAGVIEGVLAYCREEDLSPRDVCEVVHATTVATNSILERKGAKVALITTLGFRDVQVRAVVAELLSADPTLSADALIRRGLGKLR